MCEWAIKAIIKTDANNTDTDRFSISFRSIDKIH